MSNSSLHEKPFEALQQVKSAINEFNMVVVQAANALVQAAVAMSQEIVQWTVEALDFSLSALAVIEQTHELSVTEQLEQFGLFAVDPMKLSGEDLWQYQKWILTAPLRWVKRVFHSD